MFIKNCSCPSFLITNVNKIDVDCVSPVINATYVREVHCFLMLMCGEKSLFNVKMLRHNKSCFKYVKNFINSHRHACDECVRVYMLYDGAVSIPGPQFCADIVLINHLRIFIMDVPRWMQFVVVFPVRRPTAWSD